MRRRSHVSGGAHIEDSVGAAGLRLDEADLAEIDWIQDGAVAAGGPTPESV